MMELIFDTEYTDGAKTEDEASPSPSKGGGVHKALSFNSKI